MKSIPNSLVPWILSLFMLIFTDKIHAANYYIDQNHPAANDQNKGTIDQPWKTLVKANQTLIAGDTVFIRSGIYNSFIDPDNSGTAIALITFKNYGTDKVTIADATYGIFLNEKSYISVLGINFQNLDRFLYLQHGSNYNIIAYCNFDQARMTNGKTVAWAGSIIKTNSKYNWIHHCRFSKYGYFTDDDKSCIMDIGDENVITDFTSHNLIENCTFFHGGHHVLGVFGMFNVIRNNYVHNEAWSLGTPQSDRGEVLYGDRIIYVSGYVENSGWNLFEGNQIAYSSDPSDDVGATGMTLTTSHNIIRFNRFYYNDMAGLTLCAFPGYCQDIVYNKIYQNTFLHNSLNDQSSKCGIAYGLYRVSFIMKYNSFKNNLFLGHKRLYGNYKILLENKANIEDQIFGGNWDGDSLGDPKFINAGMIPGDPMDSSFPDLHLQPDSPCKNKGTYLTKIISASGSGNSFMVEDAGYFIDGWGIRGVNGDEIQFYPTSKKAWITGINYSTGMITLDRKVSWKQGQGISLSYNDAAPDVGAYELK
jgi:hypothetical protein